MTTTTILGPKPLVEKHGALLWRVGTSGGAMMLLAFLPFPLVPQISLCGFLWLTGRPCPFCGLTRALAWLLRGDLALALSLHPLSPLALSGLLIVFLGRPLRSVWERAGLQALSSESSRLFWRGYWLIFLAYGAWRICMGNHS